MLLLQYRSRVLSRNTAVQYDIVSANQAYCFAVHVRALLANQLQGMNLILETGAKKLELAPI